MKLIYTLLIGMAISSCEDDSYPILLETNQVERLLGGEEEKIWYPETDIICEEDNATIFTRTVHADSLAVYTVQKGEALCPGDSGQDITGSWEVLKPGNSHRLNIFAEDTLSYTIILLTASQMHLQTEEKEVRYFSPLVVD